MGEVLDALQVWGIWVLFVFVAWNVYRNVSLFSVRAHTLGTPTAAAW